MANGSGWNLWVWLAGGGCRWNLWVWLVGVVVRRYIDFLILLIPTPLVSALFGSSIPTFCSFFDVFNVYSIDTVYCELSESLLKSMVSLYRCFIYTIKSGI